MRKTVKNWHSWKKSKSADLKTTKMVNTLINTLKQLFFLIFAYCKKVIHHTIQKWGWDLWVIMSLLWPNKTAAHFCLWNLESYKCEGLDKYQNILPTQANPGLFSKGIHQFYVPGSAPVVHAHHELLKVTHSAHNRGLCHQLLNQQEQWHFQSPPHTRTAKQGSRGNIQVSMQLSQIHCQTDSIMLILHF